MIEKRHKRLKSTYIPAIAVLLFAAVVSVIICVLYASNEAYLRKQEEALQSTPITVTVRGVPVYEGHKAGISPWTIDLFTGKNPVKIQDMSSENREITQISLSEYLQDVRIKMSRSIININDWPALDQTTHVNPDLIGITSIPSDERLLPENGCEITWYEGYDESVLGGEDPVCLVPAGKVEAYDNGNGEAVLYFYYAWGRMENGAYVEVSRTEYECTLKIVGTYTAGDEMSFYCPFSIIEQVYSGLEERTNPDSISATIADNLLLDEFREKARFFYSNLSENTEEVSDGIRVLNRSKKYTLDNSFNALDIDDSELLDFMSDLEDNNIKFYRIVTVAIIAFSIVTGFLIGFLMIRLRKSDIMLMRTNGKSNPKIYFGLVLEQMMCIILGVIIGGAYNMWKPIDKLLIFAVGYFVALSLALMIFMSKSFSPPSRRMNKQ